VLSYVAGPRFRPMTHRNSDTSVQVLAGAARVGGPVLLGGGSYLPGELGVRQGLGGWRGSRIRGDGCRSIRTGVDYMRTSYFEPSLRLRGQSNIRSTASIVYSREALTEAAPGVAEKIC
jgi:hypothetical protein